MKKLVFLAVAATVAVSANAQWSANFDSYANGMQLHGVDNWQGWWNTPANGALVSNAQSSSGPNSVEVLGPNVDLVQPFNGMATSGIWMLSAEVYVPTGYTNPANQASNFILVNEYVVNAGDWSVQMAFDSISGNVIQGGGSGNTFVGTPTPIVFDQWVAFNFLIDLDSNSVVGTYNNVQVLTGQWYGANGTAEIAAMDLFAWNGTTIYYDNFNLEAVPEPATFVAIGVGLAGLLALRRRK
jgi:hypothetical protein